MCKTTQFNLLKNCLRSVFRKGGLLSIFQDYITAAFLIILGVALVLLWFSFYTIEAKRDGLLRELRGQAQIIDNEISNTLSYISRIVEDKGRKIGEIPSLSEEDIYFHFKRKFNHKPLTSGKAKLFLWPRLSWLNIDGDISVTSDKAIISQPEKVNLQPYQFKAYKNFWQLFLSKPVLENGRSIIYGAMGIAGQEGDYIGSIVTRLESDKIIRNISFILGEKKAHYIVLDQDFDLLLSSDSLTNLPGHILTKIKKISSSQSLESVQIDSMEYRLLYFSSNYPFAILLGHDAVSYKKEIFAVISQRIIEVVIVATFFVLVIWYFYKRVIAKIMLLARLASKIRDNNYSLSAADLRKKPREKVPEQIFILERALLKAKRYIKQKTEAVENLKKANQQLEEAKRDLQAEKQLSIRAKKLGEAFFAQIRTGLNKPISAIKRDLEKLTHNDLQNNPIEVAERLKIYSDILKNISFLGRYTTDELYLTDVDVVKIINNNAEYYAVEALDDNIKILLEFKEDLPLLLADEIRFNQIINSLIYRALQDAPRSFVKISADLLLKAGKKYLRVIIADDGNGLSEEKRQKLFNLPKYDKNELIPRMLNISDLHQQDIMQLVELHKGSLDIKIEHGVGTIATLLFPYRSPEKIYKDPNFSKNEGAKGKKTGKIVYLSGVRK